MTLDTWLARLETQHPRSIELGLERVRAVAQVMALPHPAKQVVIVGGTNGKGSTVAFIESVARADGWRVGCYTSPHIHRYNERMRINGVDVDDAALIDAFEAVEQARVRAGVSLTYFEHGTLAALWWFSQSNLDLAVLEVGLGGRLDAVNLIDADVAVITTVDLDHQDWLGSDRESIGAEKAGIARAWKPLVLGDDDPPASVLRHAYAIGASALRIGCDFFFEPVDDQHWRWREIGFECVLPMPQLDAPVQLRNAAVAITALRALPHSPSQSAYAAGIANARLPGRLQHLQRDGIDIHIDVGHNPQAARALAQWLEQRPIEGRTFAVYAALADKDAAGVVDALRHRVDVWMLAGLNDAGPRGMSAVALRDKVQATPAVDASMHDDVASALAAAHSSARAGDRILVFGSFHTAAAVLEALQAS